MEASAIQSFSLVCYSQAEGGTVLQGEPSSASVISSSPCWFGRFAFVPAVFSALQTKPTHLDVHRAVNTAGLRWRDRAPPSGSRVQMDSSRHSEANPDHIGQAWPSSTMNCEHNFYSTVYSKLMYAPWYQIAPV